MPRFGGACARHAHRVFAHDGRSLGGVPAERRFSARAVALFASRLEHAFRRHTLEKGLDEGVQELGLGDHSRVCRSWQYRQT
jgi:hypothetical protein